MLGAALSYYTIFSLAPLLLVIISIAGLLFGREAIEGKLFEQLDGFLGKDGAGMIQGMVKGASEPSQGIVSLVIGGIILLLGASGVFGQLKSALNQIWNVEPKPDKGVFTTLRERFLSFAMVGVIAFLLVVSLVASIAIGFLSNYLTKLLPVSSVIIEVMNFLVSLVLLSLLFAFIFKVLPDIKLPWKVVRIGAFVTALLFTIGKSLIGLYIGNSAVGNTYGAASSLVVILLWVYYTAQIVFFGAEFTKVYAQEKKIPIPTSDYGRPIIQKAKIGKKDGIVPKDTEHAATLLAGYAVKGAVKEIIKETTVKHKSKISTKKKKSSSPSYKAKKR